MGRLKIRKGRGVSGLPVVYPIIREAIVLCNYVGKVYKGVRLLFCPKELGI